MIDIPDDGNVEKVFEEENVVGPKPVVIFQELDKLNVEFDMDDVAKTSVFLRLGHVESLVVGVGELGN